MKFYVFFLFLFLIKYITSENDETNCTKENSEKIDARDDCQLSLEAKKKYKYCCFENITRTNSCTAFTQSDYEILKEALRTNESNNFIFECNSSAYLQILLMLDILLFIF